jgi:hypothetical protein
MKNNQIESLLVNVSQILAMMGAVNINKENAAIHADTLKTARAKLDKLQALRQDEVYWKSLSPIEQKTMMENAQNIYQVHQELVKELDFLDLSKQPTFVSNAVNELNHAFLLIEWLSGEIGKSGRTILPHLPSLRAETFDKGKYKNQIDTLYSDLEAIGHDFWVDHVINEESLDITSVAAGYPMLIPICDHLTVAACWLKKEKERLLTEALPELKVIKLPEEVKPEIPIAPEKELKN